MKKHLLLAAIFVQITFVFGQQQWSNWVKATCNQGIQGSAINYGYNQYGKGYEWNWKVKNTYSKTVTFDLYFKVGNDKKSWGVFTLAPGEERKHVSFYYNDASPSFLITVENVFFGTLSEPNSKRCWAECDNGSPVCNVKDGQNSSNTTTQATTQQNDLTEYNRSKTDLERQMNEKNAEIQQKSQNYTTAMNAGIIAYNSGNYEEAKRQFSIALNNSNTEEARQKAQEYYNKSVVGEKKNQYNNNLNEASTNLHNKDYNGAIQSFGNAMNSATNKTEKRNAATGVIASGVAGVFDILAKAKEEKRQEQENEKIKQEKKQRELREANDLMEANWQKAITLANKEDYLGAINIMKPYLYLNKLNAFSLSRIGYWYYQSNDNLSAKKIYDMALSLDKKSCAMHYMGDLYRYGKGVDMNYDIALTYYMQSCENGDSIGCITYDKFKPVAIAKAEEKKQHIIKSDKTVGEVVSFYKNGLFGFKSNATNEIKIPEKYSEVGGFSNGLALAKLGDRYGYIDKLGNVAIPFNYTEAFDFNNGVAIVATNIQLGNSGYKHKVDYEMLDITGKTIAKYFLMYNFKEGLARARTDDKKWGFIDESGQIAIPFKFDEVEDFEEGFAKVRVWNGKDFKYGYIDKTGSIVIPGKFDFMSENFSEGMAKVEIDDKYGFIDTSGNIVIPPKYTNSYPHGFSEGLSAVEKSKKYGFVDKNGVEVIPLKYRNAGDFSEGLAYVALKDKYGFINKNGIEIIPLIYEMCWSFKNGLAKVKLNGKYGFIDKNGTIKIPFKYDDLGEFINGFAKIKLKDKFGMIDKNGNEYW